MSRLAAGLQLGGLILFWVILWVPLALYWLLAVALSPLFPEFPRFRRALSASAS